MTCSDLHRAPSDGFSCPFSDLDGGTMARIVKRTRDGPYPVTIGGETKHICGCGLSNNSAFLQRHPQDCPPGRTQQALLVRRGKATASKPLTATWVFAVRKSESGSHDARSVLSAYRLGADLRKRGCRYCGFSDAEASRGFYRTRMGTTPKRRPHCCRARVAGAAVPPHPPSALGTWYSTTVAIQTKPRARGARGRHSPGRSFCHNW